MSSKLDFGSSVIINAQYVKDLSFENPKALNNMLTNETPKVNVSIGVDVSSVHDQVYETLLRIEVKSTIQDNIQYLIDLKYAGIFTLEKELNNKEKVLFVECPNIIFPYTRRIISDLIQDGGYFPVYIAPVDFLTLYKKTNINIDLV